MEPITYIIFWLAVGVGYPELLAHRTEREVAADCKAYGEITKQETKAVVLTCYVKQGDGWAARRP